MSTLPNASEVVGQLEQGKPVKLVNGFIKIIE